MTPAATLCELIPLDLLRPGQSAVVGQVVGRPEHVHRLEEMGLRQGVEVEVVQPGSPCIIRLRGRHNLCFRGDEITSVLVQRMLGGAAWQRRS